MTAYICGICKGKFERTRDDLEAKKECEETWGIPVAETEERAELTCEDCYKKVLIFFNGGMIPK